MKLFYAGGFRMRRWIKTEFSLETQFVCLFVIYNLEGKRFCSTASCLNHSAAQINTKFKQVYIEKKTHSKVTSEAGISHYCRMKKQQHTD